MDNALIRVIMVGSVRLALMMALPLIGSGMIVGFIVAILQATTSIQEQTLTFIPKIIAIFLALVIFGPWIASNIVDFARQIFELIPSMALPVP
ncbi:MAG: flagellar biosynthesis protein FliQ [Spirochaetes bacterium]|nr:flagellar biosynthesis protein FliQ [Spirochaetota bacterium]